MNLNQILYGICILLTGLLAGLFYGYQCSIINGLGRLNNREYLSAFQRIDAAILNPVFFLSFMGSIIVLAITTIVMYRAGNTELFRYLIIAAAIYGTAVFGITILYNVPLNETLAAFDIQSASDSEIGQMRNAFETKWNKWHLIRTWASIGSFVTLIIPLIKRI